LYCIVSKLNSNSDGVNYDGVAIVVFHKLCGIAQSRAAKMRWW